MGFNKCKNLGHCGEELCIPEFCHKYDPIIPTNADRIRAMSDEELAEFLEEASWICANQVCRKCPLSTGTENCKSVEEWLKQPADMRGEEE